MTENQNTIQQNSQWPNHWYSQNLIGKTVFDAKNHNCGKIQSFLIDPEKFSISGVIVKQRFFKEYFLSRDYFDKISSSGLFLNSIPIKPNTRVVNTEGKNKGRVIRINHDRKTSQFQSLVVKSGFRKKIIFADKIIGIGEKVTIQSN